MTKWWLSIMLIGGPASAQSLDFEARLYNQANVPQELLIVAATKANYVLRTAGVHVSWTFCNGPGTCTSEAGRNGFQILVRKAAPARTSGSIKGEALGAALLPGNGPGLYAMIYYSQVCQLVGNRIRETPGEVLGYVIAHEIGHLLLGPQHVHGTVMQAQWNKPEVELIRKGQLRFNRSQNLAKHGEGTLISAVLPR